MKFNKRLYKCLFRDTVDLLFWLAVIFFFILSQVKGSNVNGVLVVVAFYLYNVMYRLNHYYQDRAKFYQYLKEQGLNPEHILEEMEDV